MATWPTELQNANINVTCSPRGNRRGATTSTGYDKVRPKFTKRYRDYSVEVEMSVEEYDIFLRFFHNDLGYGEVAFFFPDPLLFTSFLEVRFKVGEGEQPFTVSPLGRTEDLLISFVLEEEDPRVATGAPTNIWPTQLPPLPLHNSFSQSEQSGLVRDTGNNGKIEVRRRFNATSTYNEVAMILTKEQLSIFESFFIDQGYGCLPFSMPAPIYDDDGIKVRWSLSSPPYTIEYDNDSLDYYVTFGFEELPGQTKVLDIDYFKITTDEVEKITTGYESKITNED